MCHLDALLAAAWCFIFLHQTADINALMQCYILDMCWLNDRNLNFTTSKILLLFSQGTLTVCASLRG